MREDFAFVFPGQGSQQLGMGRDLSERSPAARGTLEEADDALGLSLRELMWSGSSEELSLTQNAQPAILAVSIAALRAMLEALPDLTPRLAAGHSLGEYSALVCAGAMTLADALRAVRLRGQLMQQAVPVGRGTMAAVVGLDADSVAAVVAEVSTAEEPVGVAGFNSPEQTTLSGTTAGVAKATAAVTERGAQRVIPLQVSAPFHSVLMEPVKKPLREHLEACALVPPRVPVVTNVNATPNADADRVVDLLIAQLTEPVRWLQSVQDMRKRGISHFLELGTGRSLCGMIRRIDRSATCMAVGDAATLDATVDRLH